MILGTWKPRVNKEAQRSQMAQPVSHIGMATRQLLVAAMVWIFATLVTQAQVSKNILVLHGGSSKTGFNLVSDEQIEHALEGDRNLNAQIFNEYRDEKRLNSDDLQYLKFLSEKYRGERIDLILAVGPAPLGLLLTVGNAAWENVPVVFSMVETRTVPSHLPPNFTGVEASVDFAGTIDLALHLHPDLNRVFYVVGVAEYEQSLRHIAEQELKRFQGRLEIEYLQGMPLADLLNRIAEMPAHSIVFYDQLNKDVSGRVYIPYQVASQLATASNVPVYSPYSVMLGSGVVGGSRFDLAAHARQAARMAVRILRGESVKDLAVEQSPPSTFAVDWRQLQRWQIPESRLPVGTIVEYREPGVWHKYKGYILAAVILVMLQALLLVYLLAERRRRRLAQKHLSDRLRFETLVSQVSSEFANIGYGEIDGAIGRSLRHMRDFFGANIASIWEPAVGKPACIRSHVLPEGEGYRCYDFPLSLFPNTTLHLFHGEVVSFTGDEERSKQEDRESFCRAGVRSFLGIPLQVEGRTLGAVVLKSVARETLWPPEIVQRLRTVGDILAVALARQNTADALRESELLKGTILESMRSGVAIIDHDGVIVEVNRYWLEFAGRNGDSVLPYVSTGANYPEACRNASFSNATTEALVGIQSVLNNSQAMFEMEYPVHSSSEQRWFRMTVMRLPGARGGALISRLEITPQKLAELEQQRMQEETLRLNRTTEMGQLLASLAHELAQPLAAVLSNAQAASRLAARPTPELHEIQAALMDIIEDDQRAGAVLNSVRDMLKKHAVSPHKVNLNEVVKSVAAMVRNNAQLRGVQLKSILSEDAVLVQGDEIPLQQVVLNLVNNSIDAMSQVPMERRVLTLKTAIRAENGFALLEVEDQGPGVPDALQAKLFQPFFTTKGDGLGMGLAICSTIVQSFGGSIHLQDHADHGATFQVELRLAA